ncbi:hypothetical protein NSERKGN1266_10800 [Nocardia seriolae]|nr:hypothetical protein NSERKGN1266_10800 [Nocardia seriolae]
MDMSGYGRELGDWEERVRGMLVGAGWAELGRGRLRVLGEGQDHLAVSAVVAGERFVVRMPKGEDGAEGIAREARLLAELAVGVRLEIPRYLFTAVNPIGPGECCVYPEVPGEVLGGREWRARGLLERGRRRGRWLNSWMPCMLFRRSGRGSSVCRNGIRGPNLRRIWIWFGRR